MKRLGKEEEEEVGERERQRMQQAERNRKGEEMSERDVRERE